VLRTPLVEWYEVKALPDPTSIQSPADAECEQLGCWSTRHENEPKPGRVESIANNLRLDVAYTRMAGEARTRTRTTLKIPSSISTIWCLTYFRMNLSFPLKVFLLWRSHLLDIVYPPMRRWPVSTISTILRPLVVKHLNGGLRGRQCGDLLRNTCILRITSRIWPKPLTRPKIIYHMWVLHQVVSLAIKNTFQFIAVHMRRGDFKQQCYDGTPEDKCLMTLSRFKEEVNLILDSRRNQTETESWCRMNGTGSSGRRLKALDGVTWITSRS